ncbi:centrosome and spindle pole associated protein 1-like isoform X1 [Scophthalmus maximus]|uniref:centrosome and spindle pole associated protein 1-like isoform X1 n=1 Tax=Scophthalmus maximus TaxID=52904 RepID=UPI001FA91FBC|nr:centrosome and spindle pole associated protein 1-like isoform X1 [Scophthalmus maximus]
MDDELENFIRERKARVAEDKAGLQQDPPYMEIKAKPHRAYGSTVKENIPPKSVAQGKEESCSVGLPLGVEYERKKQRLQHELRMDFRHFMAQLEDKMGILSKQRASSSRSVSALTEDNKRPHRALRLAEIKVLSPEEEEEEEVEEQSPLTHRQPDRLGRLVNHESEDDENFREELELTEGRRCRPAGTEAGYERRRTNKSDGREKRENPVSFGREGRQWRAPSKNETPEFATGLLIGAADTEEALRRRKERYRRELLEQIADQHRNKKRERDLELKVAATGANDPEKQPDRIRQFGLSRRKDLQVSELSATRQSDSSSRGLPSNVKIGGRERETPPPERPHMAFQSPLLEYSSALGLGGGGLSPNSQPAAPSFPRAVDTHRIPVFPPHPPSTLSDAYRNLYAAPHHCYGNRNLLDPNMAYYGPSSVPGAGLPMYHWNLPPGGAVSSQFGNHSPHSQHSGSSFPEPPIQPYSEAPPVDSHISVFPSERSKSSRERGVIYRDALKEQEASRRGSSELYTKIQEQQERRRLERDERERHDAQLEADLKYHQPWGRGGGGAPLRDGKGNLIADLNQMHKRNEEVYINPEQWQRRAAVAMTARPAEYPDPNARISGEAESSLHDSRDQISGFTHVHTPQFARGNVFANQPTQHQLQEQDKYKAYLKQQIEEKMHKKAEEMEKTRLEEEKEEKRLAEQRACIQREFEEEQEKKKRKEMESKSISVSFSVSQQKAKNEELIHLAQQRKKEAERKEKEAERKEKEAEEKEVERQKKEAEEQENAALRRLYELERQARVEEVCRRRSPPIPTLQKKTQGPRQYTPRPPTADSQHSTAPLSERSLSGLQSPPVPACRNQIRAAGDKRDVFIELSAMRRQLRSERKRLEGRQQQGDCEELDPTLSDRHQERPPVDVFDMARLRLQAPVRRPNSRNTEPRNLLRIHDSLQLNCTGGKSKLGFSEVPKLEEMGVTSRRRHDHRDPYYLLSSQRSTAQDDYFDLSPPHQNEYLRSMSGQSGRGSLLESESAFIDPLGDAFPLPRTPDPDKAPLLSARERRRLAKQLQHAQERAASSQCLGQHYDCSTHTGTRLHQEAERRSPNRTAPLTALSRRGNTAGPVDLSDDDDDSSPPQFSLHNLNHQSFVETDPWLRPGRSDTLRCLGRPSRKARLVT